MTDKIIDHSIYYWDLSSIFLRKPRTILIPDEIKNSPILDSEKNIEQPTGVLSFNTPDLFCTCFFSFFFCAFSSFSFLFFTFFIWMFSDYSFVFMNFFICGFSVSPFVFFELLFLWFTNFLFDFSNFSFVVFSFLFVLFSFFVCGFQQHHLSFQLLHLFFSASLCADFQLFYLWILRLSWKLANEKFQNINKYYIL